MGRYHNKQVTVEAFRLGTDEYPQWFVSLGIEAGRATEYDNGNIGIKRMVGESLAFPGDYVIKGPGDELGSCDPMTFMRTYDEETDDGHVVSEVLTIETVDFDTGALGLVPLGHETPVGEVLGVVVNLGDVCVFEPYHAGQRFRVSIEEV